MIDLSAPPASLSPHRAFVVQFRAETAVAAGHLVSISSRAGSHVRHLGRPAGVSRAQVSRGGRGAVGGRGGGREVYHAL